MISRDCFWHSSSKVSPKSNKDIPFNDTNLISNEKAHSLQWLNTEVPPPWWNLSLAELAPPSTTLELTRVYGCYTRLNSGYLHLNSWRERKATTRGFNSMICWINDTSILYAVAAVCIVEDIVSGKQKFFLDHSSDILCVSYNSTTEIAASGGSGLDESAPLFIWNPHSMELIARIHTEHIMENSITDLSFRKDGKVLCAASYLKHHVIALFSTSTGYCFAKLTGDKFPISQLIYDYFDNSDDCGLNVIAGIIDTRLYFWSSKNSLQIANGNNDNLLSFSRQRAVTMSKDSSTRSNFSSYICICSVNYGIAAGNIDGNVDIFRNQHWQVRIRLSFSINEGITSMSSFKYSNKSKNLNNHQLDASSCPEMNFLLIMTSNGVLIACYESFSVDPSDDSSKLHWNVSRSLSLLNLLPPSFKENFSHSSAVQYKKLSQAFTVRCAMTAFFSPNLSTTHILLSTTRGGTWLIRWSFSALTSLNLYSDSILFKEKIEHSLSSVSFVRWMFPSFPIIRDCENSREIHASCRCVGVDIDPHSGDFCSLHSDGLIALWPSPDFNDPLIPLRYSLISSPSPPTCLAFQNNTSDYNLVIGHDNGSISLWNSSLLRCNGIIHGSRPGIVKNIQFSSNNRFVGIVLRRHLLASVIDIYALDMNPSEISHFRPRIIKIENCTDSLITEDSDAKVSQTANTDEKWYFLGSYEVEPSIRGEINELDWSVDNHLVRCCTTDVELFYILVPSCKKFKGSTESLCDVEWKTHYGRVGWGVEGIWGYRNGGRASVSAVARNPSMRFVAAGYPDGAIRLYRFPSIAPFIDEGNAKTKPFPRFNTSVGHTGSISMMRWSPNSHFLFSTSTHDGSIMAWRVVSRIDRFRSSDVSRGLSAQNFIKSELKVCDDSKTDEPECSFLQKNYFSDNFSTSSWPRGGTKMLLTTRKHAFKPRTLNSKTQERACLLKGDNEAFSQSHFLVSNSSTEARREITCAKYRFFSERECAKKSRGFLRSY